MKEPRRKRVCRAELKIPLTFFLKVVGLNLTEGDGRVRYAEPINNEGR